jgi:predicted negative regulator of RcsB-dependent stress response
VRAEARRQLKQDKFTRTTIQVAEQTVHWTVEHQGKLIAAAVVLVVVILAALGSWYYLEKQNETASADFGKAVSVLDTPVRPAGMPAQPDVPSFASAGERATEARKQLQTVIDKYPHTHAADFSHYLLGTTAASAGDNATAERELKTVAGYHDADLSSLAKIGLASVYRNEGKTQDAVNLYKQLVEKPTRAVSKASAEIALADTYQGLGNTVEAKKVYEQLKKDSPSGPAAQIANEKLQALK